MKVRVFETTGEMAEQAASRLALIREALENRGGANIGIGS